VYAVLAVYSPTRCSRLVNGAQALFIRMATILEFAYGLFWELCSQFEGPCGLVCSHGFLPLPVLSFELQPRQCCVCLDV
jgi:hypothetical protein